MAVLNYETVFIAEPEIQTEKVDQLVAKFKQIITDSGGAVAGEDRWGRRRLAYPIAGHREGFYDVLTFSGESAVVAALDHYFNVTDSVLRHMTIKVIKKTKKFAPRRERPAGAADGPRGSGRPGSGRPRVEYARPATATAAAPAVTPAASAAAPAVTEAAPAPEKTPADGGTPS
ncbi:MAG TPA: 30S ribosomal protein S6 [Elusimicrobiota bacterium]|nr:30S ribosomal protein S6 [Elusimicrobiota bacterium]